MSASCCHTPKTEIRDGTYRRVLWAVLCVHALMFLIEVTAGLAAGAVSLQADALDSLGDTANYRISDVIGNLAVLFAAWGVFGTGRGWPDIVVALMMGGLALQGAWLVIRHATSELRSPMTLAGQQ